MLYGLILVQNRRFASYRYFLKCLERLKTSMASVSRKVNIVRIVKIAGNCKYCANTKCFKLKTLPLNKAERVVVYVSILTVKLIANLGKAWRFFIVPVILFSLTIGLGICDFASINSIRGNNLSLFLLNISFANRVLEK